MTFHIDKDGKSVNRVDDNRHQWLPHLDICERDKDMSDPYAAGYRPAVSVDLSQCNNLHRQKALADHKAAIAQAETDAYAKPVPIKGIDWSVWAFIAAMAMLGICIALGVAMVMS